MLQHQKGHIMLQVFKDNWYSNLKRVTDCCLMPIEQYIFQLYYGEHKLHLMR
jgi:hypothetical protein